MKRSSVMVKSLLVAGSLLVVLIVARGLLLAPITSANSPSQPPIPLGREVKIIESGKNIAQQIAVSNNDFGFDLLKVISSKSEEKNVIFSPFSISLAMSMALAGARGQTAKEIQAALHLPSQTKDSPAYLSASFAARLADSLSKLTTEKPDHTHKREKEGETVLLNIANAVWAQQNSDFESDFLQTLDQEFHTPLHQTNFANNAKDSIDAINGWVSKQTRNRINRLVSENSIDQYTMLVLVNAIYFKGSWAVPFKSDMTHDADFTLNDKSTVKSSFLRRVGSYSYYSDDDNSHGRQPQLCSGCKAVEIPYYDGASMLLILPSETSPSIELDTVTLSTIHQGLRRRKIDLSMPKFEFSADFELSDCLRSLGVSQAFEASLADFTGMIDAEDVRLYISKVLHKAFISVNEQGTEAAAATAVVVSREMLAAYEPPAVVIRYDRPFYFVIQAADTGAALFIGRVANPTKR